MTFLNVLSTKIPNEKKKNRISRSTCMSNYKTAKVIAICTEFFFKQQGLIFMSYFAHIISA